MYCLNSSKLLELFNAVRISVFVYTSIVINPSSLAPFVARTCPFAPSADGYFKLLIVNNCLILILSTVSVPVLDI